MATSYKFNRFDVFSDYERAILPVALTLACEWIEGHDNRKMSNGRAWATLQDLIAESEGRTIPLPDTNDVGA